MSCCAKNSLIALLLMVLVLVGESRKNRTGCGFSAIFNFGDSNSDTGAISAAFWRTPQPNGETYFHKPAGRASDGLLIIDFITQELNLDHLHAYLDPVGAKFRSGANFATGGSTIQMPTMSFFQGGPSPFYLNIQLNQFTQLRQRSNESITEGTWYKDQLPRADVFSNALYTFDIGQNDLYGILTWSTDQARKNAIAQLLTQYSDVIQSLYSQGARSFWIHNTGPFGCLPHNVIFAPRVNGSRDEHGCVQAQNDIAQEFNRQLRDLVKELRSRLPSAALTYVDVYSAKYALISHAAEFGFVDPLGFCCGHAGYDYRVSCGNTVIVNGSRIQGTACSNPTSYISWDGVHYSHTANQLIAKQIMNGSYSEPPVGLSAACRR